MPEDISKKVVFDAVIETVKIIAGKNPGFFSGRTDFDREKIDQIVTNFYEAYKKVFDRLYENQ